MIQVKLDTTDYSNLLKKVGVNLPTSIQKSLFEIGGELLRLSRKEVPHDTGMLQSTGTVQKVRNFFGGVSGVEVGYHTVYASRLHEHPEYRFQKGRKGKYLEDPLKANTSKFMEKLASDIKKELS